MMNIYIYICTFYSFDHISRISNFYSHNFPLFFSSKASTAISFNRISIVRKSKIPSNYRKDTRAASQ